MQITKVLARKDGYTLIVAILLAFVTSSMVSQISMNLTNKLFGSSDGSDFNFMPTASAKQQYLLPVVAWVISVLFIEVVLVLVASLQKPKKAGKGKK